VPVASGAIISVMDIQRQATIIDPEPAVLNRDRVLRRQLVTGMR
jgi:hypothetical protein